MAVPHDGALSWRFEEDVEPAPWVEDAIDDRGICVAMLVPPL